MKKAKIWKKRIFASLVAVCMVFTLLPATAVAAEGTETEGQLVVDVVAAKPNPAPMMEAANSDPDKKTEVEGYQQNMAAIEDVKWDSPNNTVTVMADRSKMMPYFGGGGWKTYYALVMNFRDDMTLMTEPEGGEAQQHIKGDSRYEIDETMGKDITQAKQYVPVLKEDNFNKPIVFWLNARDDVRTFTLTYTDPTTKKTESQEITVKINDTSKLVKSAAKAKSDFSSNDLGSIGMSEGELECYKTNMQAIKDVNTDDLANGIVKVTANRKAMESYYYKPGKEVKKQKHYALVMNIDSLKESNEELNAEEARAEGCTIDKAKGPLFVPSEPETQATEVAPGQNPIVFWLDAEKDTSKVTLYREITQNKAGSGSADPEGKTGDLSEDTDSSEAEPEVVYRVLQEITITVKDSIDSIVPTITLNKNEATIKKGEIITLEETKTPETADVSWESDNEDVAMVSGKGVVAGVGEGEATITATVTVPGEGGQSETATCDITVTDNGSSGTEGPAPGVSGGSNGPNGSLLPQNADIALNQDTALIYAKAKKQNTVQLKAVVVGNSKKVTWRSLNPRIATVKNGKVTAKKAGKATITATANGLTAKCIVTVKNPTIKLAKAKATIKKGKKVRINATVTPASKITYKSNKKRVATVTAKGVVKGKKKGTAKITVTANSVKKTFTVRVK